MSTVDWIGWASSMVLIATLSKQVIAQWKSGKYEGVSRWLFIGQMLASTGFTIYSVLLENWVFTATNGLLLINALAGQWVSMRNRKRAEQGGRVARSPEPRLVPRTT